MVATFQIITHKTHPPFHSNPPTQKPIDRYVDVLGFFLTPGRKFPIGVAKYITWPETSWARRLTSTHHLWFIPVCLAFGPVGFIDQGGGFD